MKKIKFILVNDKAALPRFNGPKAQFKVQCGFAAVQSGFAAGQSGSEREGLIEELCRLRKLYPKAKILGVSELGEHCVHPSERMNQLRRELSDLGGFAAVQGSRFKVRATKVEG